MKKAYAPAGLLLCLCLLLGSFLPAWGDIPPPPNRPTPVPAPRTRLLVSAAASLRDVFTTLGAAFKAEHPGVVLDFNFAASGVLEAQIRQGAPVDLFASAGVDQMDRLERAGLVAPGSRKNFATNELVLITPYDKVTVTRLQDLEGSGIRRVAVGNPVTVPAGQYAKESLQWAGVWDAIQGKLVMAENVRQVLTYVRIREVDAGLVYRSDALGDSQVRIAAWILPLSHSPITYPMAVMKQSRQPQLAAQFEGFVLSPAGRQILKRAGFGLP